MSRTIPVVTAVLLASFLPATAGAASCREELAAFERRLNESSLAAAAPDRYAELARAAEEVSELRDETLCMERVAELNAALGDTESAPPGTTGRSAPAPAEDEAPPSPPLLLEASPVDYGRDASAGGNEDDESDGQSH